MTNHYWIYKNTNITVASLTSSGISSPIYYYVSGSIHLMSFDVVFDAVYVAVHHIVRHENNPHVEHLSIVRSLTL